jgi:hypothetical protein
MMFIPCEDFNDNSSKCAGRSGSTLVAYGILAISNGIKSKGKNISAELIKES